MNIIFLYYHRMNPLSGGIERVSNQLAKEFTGMGHNVYFVSIAEYLPDDGYTPITEELILPDFKNKCSVANVELLTGFVRSRDIHIIICQNSYDREISHLAYMVRQRSGAKLLYVFHTTPYFRSLSIADTPRPLLSSERTFLKEYRRIMRSLLKKQKQKSRDKKMGKQIYCLHEMGDGVVFLSERYIQSAIDISGLKSSGSLFAIHNPNTYNEKDIVTTPKENTLLFLGRLSREKRPEKAMKIWRQIQHRFPGWNLKIVGDGELKDDLEKLKKTMLLERCTLEGRKAPEAYYQKAKILLVTSDFEGFGVAITEAMQHGVVPVVFNSYEALPEIIEDNVTGICVTPYNLNEFQDRLVALMQDNEKRETMARAGKTTVKRFALSAITPQWIEVFEKIGIKESYY